MERREEIADIIDRMVSGPHPRDMTIDPALHRQDQLAAADAILALDRPAASQGEVERLREALEQIEQWAASYPAERFLEPDLEGVKLVLRRAGMENQMDRMHASWARHLVDGIGDIARAALSPTSRPHPADDGEKRG